MVRLSVGITRISCAARCAKLTIGFGSFGSRWTGPNGAPAEEKGGFDMKDRTTLVTMGTALVLAAAIVGITASPAFAAACGNGQGQALLMGCNNNTATDDTSFSTSSSGGAVLLLTATGPGSTTGLSAVASATGVYASGDTAVYAQGGHTGVVGFAASGGTGVSGVGDPGVAGTGGSGIGVSGIGDTAGVYGTTLVSSGQGVFGENTGGGNGVYGLTNSAGASGVYGQNDGTGYGIAGRAPTGAGVFGDSHDGVGVVANSVFGTALLVNGKVSFSSAGLVLVPEGTKSVTVDYPMATTSSMVLAMAQQSMAMYVKAVVPATGSFRIVLTGKAPVGGLLVAFFVLN
jgi:hypothetical protein